MVLALGIGLAFTLDGLAQGPPTTGLVAWWRFDEVEGRVAPDSSGQGNDAIITADCGLGSCGRDYLFRGVIDEVRIYSRALSPDEVAASHLKGREGLRAQKDLVVKPEKVGAAQRVFRKPRTAITMVKDGFIWIDAEDFSDYGGWLMDTQFVHLMGSAYLIAAGVGKPVEDATVEVELPRAGTYCVWVRAKNWLKDYAPGRFQLVVNKVPLAHVFGQADTEAWLWESAGELDLGAGTVRLALRDLTGYYGRCDALVLTRDPDYRPPDEADAIQKERARLTGLSLEPNDGGSFDVVVVGAGAAGCCAAIASARMGVKTALIQNRPVLGGNASIELGVGISGAGSAHANARESGIIEEAGRVKARYGYPKMSEPFRIAADAGANLSVFLNNHVFAVTMEGNGRIAAVKAVDTLDGSIWVYRGKMFIDCTGDGWVGYYAGAKYRLGREARDEFGEDLAPEQADTITMSGCIMGGRSISYRAEDTGRPVEYTPPPWAAQLPPAEEFGRRPRGFTGGQWWLEHRGDIDDIWDAEQARDELIRISFGYWDYIKNAWPEQQRAATYALTYVPIVDAKRESRRLVGDYILTQNDVMSAAVFPDRISYGGWPLDVHHPRGIFSGKEGPFDCNPHVPIYTIPFRCLYSKNIDNLLFAGRDVSVTHMALGSVRVQGTLAALGQAAGTAAALCLEHGVTPRGLYEHRIDELQQTLVKHDQYIPGIVNEDPDDLARTATVAASSTALFEPFGKADVQLGGVHPLNMPRAVLFPVGANEKLDEIAVFLKSDRDQETGITLHLRAAKRSGDFSSARDLRTVQAVVPPQTESWVTFAPDCPIEAPYLWVWLPQTDGVSWRLMERAPGGSCRAYGNGQSRTVVKNQYYAFYTSPPIRVATDYRPENILNGVTRIIGEMSNLWASDSTQPLPQWIELGFDSPTELNTVYLTFDTDMNAAYHTVPLVPQCVRDYDLAYHDGAAWHTVDSVTANFQRRRVHRFDTVMVSKLRLTIHATNGAPSARVFEIRAYHE